MKNVKASVSKWSSHYEYRHNTIINNVLALKHDHFVAVVLLRAQLCKKDVKFDAKVKKSDSENMMFISKQQKLNLFQPKSTFNK